MLAVIDWQAGLWAMLAGLGLGFFFFGGLLLTVRQAVRSSHPSLLLIGSFVIRTGVTLGGIYLVGGGRVEQILFCLVGFVIMRQVLVKGGSGRATES